MERKCIPKQIVIYRSGRGQQCGRRTSVGHSMLK
jgi:hypothetical protein